MKAKIVTTLAALAVAMPLTAGPSFAAGESGSGTPANSCAKGKVWDDVQNKCVDAEDARLDSIYETGRDLANAGRYGEAIAVLSVAADSGDARILNYLGFAHRKQGRVLVGLGYYQEAVAADPRYTLVREYMGEAYLQLGDVEAAREQLAEIGRLCGTGCGEYAELARHIAAFEARG